MAMDATKTIGQYEVHESRQGWLLEKIGKLNRKAEKLGVPGVTLTWTGERLVEAKHDGEPTGEVTRYLLLTVEGVAPAVAGWTFVATLSHAEEAGTVIRTIPGFEGKIPTNFRQASRFVCEHCNKVRNRRDTYLLQSEAGEFKQVGTNCLGDFLGGRDPHAIAAWADLEYVVNETCGSAGGGLGGEQRVYLKTWLGFVAAVIRVETRWTSRGAARAYNEKAAGDQPVLRATADLAFQTIFARDQRARDAVAQWLPEAQDFAFGEEALEWAKATFHSKPADDRSDFEHNLVVATSGESVTVRNLGITAAVVGLYRRHLDQEIERKARETAGGNSDYIGVVGDRLVFWAKLLAPVKSWDGQFGTTHLYKLITREGNLVTWFGSSRIEELAEGGDFVGLVGTVKKLDTFRDQKQTVVNRLAVATQKQIDKATGADKKKKAQEKAEKALATRFEQLSADDW